ncbi:hypothetical protein PAPHI01_1153 [Pancytospora philotis]|nr:hypothetical protein PAPHI01_1153 [Pancytospora philotis]
MLLDPKTREYSTAHLEHRGCNPTKQLLDFFADGSAESDGSPALGTHQEWARVAQGLTLVLGDGSSTGADAEESNLIAYKKGVPGSTQVELKGNLGNFLMALAKIAGLPDEVTRELHGLLPGSAAEGQNGQVDFGKAGVSISKALNCISLMRVDVELSELHVEEEKLYGTLLLSFLPRDSCAGALPQTVELKFIPGHALFAHKLDAIVLSAAERECLEAYIEASSGCSELFLSLASESVGRFLSATDGTSLPNAHAGRLGVAGGPVEMYDRLVRWMACTDMHSQSGLVVANDQLIPAFMKHNEANFGRIQALEERLADPTTDSKSKARFNSLLKETKNKVAGSPLTILVSNILGRLPLTDKHTRDLFFQIMRFCVDERKYVFPQVVMPKKIYPEVGNSSLCRSFHPIWKLSEYEAPNMLAVYLNLSTLAGHAPINPSHCYSETEYYFEAVLSDRNRRRVLETLFKHCDKNTLRILRDNYLVRPCEAGTTRYYLLAAFWACLSASAERYEEIYQICDKWENALCPLMGHLEQKILRSRYKLSPLSSSTLAKVFPRGPTPKQLKALLRIYGLFANTEAAYDGIYEVFVARQDMLDLPFAVGYCLVLVDSYKKIYLRMSCDDHSPGDYDAIPVDLLGSFIDKLKGLYLRGADSEPEHENAFSAVDAQLKDLDECLQKIVGEILREAAKAAQRANATTTA